VTLASVRCSSAIEKGRKIRERERRVIDIDNTGIPIVCSRHYYSKMPSFKERFRSSRKYKKNKEGGTTSGEEPAAAAAASSSNATNASTTIDDHTGSAALSTYHSPHPVDYGK
jgi:hypothetical protein